MKRINRRKLKRAFNQKAKRFKVGTYVEDCRYHPCIITGRSFTRADIYGADMDVRSLVTGTASFCSWFYCGPVAMTKQQADDRVAFIRKHGWEAYLKEFIGFSDENLVEWRKANAIWDFEKDQPR